MASEMQNMEHVCIFMTGNDFDINSYGRNGKGYTRRMDEKKVHIKMVKRMDKEDKFRLYKMVNVFPTDLEDLIKKYVGEEWDENKHFIYIDCTLNPPVLVFEEWDYKIQKPTLGDLYVLKLPASVVKNLT